MILEILNIHERDNDIEFFEGTHTYIYKDVHQFHTSSTSFVKKFFKKFDSGKIIKNMMESNYWRNNKYYKMTKHLNSDYEIIQFISNLWSSMGTEATTKGTEMHDQIERFYNYVTQTNHPNIHKSFIKVELDEYYSKEFIMFMEFYHDHEHEYEPYRTEWLVYDLKYDIPGAIDMVFRDKTTGKFIICDWKRSKEIKQTPFKNDHALEPISHISDCNYYHYSLQVNLYKYILETNYNIDVSEMWIINIHPNFSKYQKFVINDFQDEIKSMLSF